MTISIYVTILIEKYTDITDFNVLSITRVLNSIAPSFVSDLLIHYKSQKAQKSSKADLLIVSKALHKNNREVNYAPNSAPHQSSNYCRVLKHMLKTYLY